MYVFVHACVYIILVVQWMIGGRLRRGKGTGGGTKEEKIDQLGK